jgi:hypothetical protein
MKILRRAEALDLVGRQGLDSDRLTIPGYELDLVGLPLFMDKDDGAKPPLGLARHSRPWYT